jgi:hypothetical protein
VTSPRDEIDDWLGGEVQPLSPPPGSLDRIRHGARRRKTRQAVFAAAGCAVVLATAVAVPPLLSGGKPGASNPPVAIAPAPTSLQPSATRSPASTRTPAATSSAPVQAQHSRLSVGTSGTPAPPRFRPTSVTFVGNNTNGVVGAVIGQAGPPCASSDCTSLAGTSNYGSTWYGVSAPYAPQPNGSAGVSQLRFANLRDGWAFGPALYETTGGGWPWHKEKTLGQRVIDVEAGGGHAYAVFATCTGAGLDYAAHCTSFWLYTSVAGSTTWTRVAVPAAFAPMTSTTSAAPLLAIGAATVYALTPSDELLSGPVTGGTLTAAGQAPCKPGPVDVSQQNAQNPGALLAAGPRVLLICGAASGTAQAQSTLYTSPDGASWTSAGVVHDSGSTVIGTATSMASAAPGQVVLATTTGIQYSGNYGKTWRAASFGGGVPASGFSYVGMTTATQGVAIPGDSSLGEIFVTSDGGLTWSPSLISG